MVVFALNILRTFINKIESTLQKIEVEKLGQNLDNVIFFNCKGKHLRGHQMVKLKKSSN